MGRSGIRITTRTGGWVRGKPASIQAALLGLILSVGLFSCDSFSFFETLDGKGGIGLEISPLAATLPVNETVAFTIKGGFPPYSLTATAGTLSEAPGDPPRWTYTAPNLTGDEVVTVKDSRGNTRQSDVTVILVGPLFLTPPELTVEVGHSAVLTAVGGNPHPTNGYSFGTTGGTLTKLSETQVRLSGLTAPGTVTVTATDDVGATSNADVTVLATVGLAISPAATTLVTGNALTFTAYGGQAPYSFSTSAGGGYLTQTSPTEAEFTAPPQTNSFTVTTTDGASNTATATVTVEAPGPLAISPSSITLLINQKVTFGASGGVGPAYAFSKTGGVGSIAPTGPANAEYTAPPFPGSATIRVTDSDTPPATATAAVTVLSPLAITPVAVTITAGRSFTFSASGGSPPYTYSVLYGAGTFVGAAYTAPLSPGTATVRVTDSLGNRSSAAVTISAVGPLTISPTLVTLRRGGDLTFHASGGVSPYTYSVVSGDGAIVASSGAFTAGDLAGTCTVRVTDSAAPANMSEATASVIWLIDTIQSLDNAGKYASLKLDVTGNAHVSYRVDNTKELWYASWDGSNWDAVLVDGTADVGEYTSLALDGAGNPHIAYYDKDGKDLKYAYWNGSSWVRQTVDGPDDVGSYASLALDGAGNPHIAYYDKTNRDLKYARWTGSSWDVQTVDGSGSDVGEYSSLALDSSGYARVAYFDGGAEDLKYARWSGSSWNISVVDGIGTKRGEYCSLKLDGLNWPSISYYDKDNKDLRYCYWNGAAWVCRVVDSAGNVGKYTSLVLDAAGAPHISYWDESNGDLKISHWIGATDLYQVVDGSGGDVGEYSSIAIDAAGNTKVVYYDATNGALLLAE